MSANWFEELGYTAAAAGRLFSEHADEGAAATPLLVISHDVWLTRLDGAADAVGRTIRVNDRLATIIGVARPDFPGLDTEMPRLWLLIDQIDQFIPGTTFKNDWGAHNAELYGRLRPGISPAAAQEGLRATMRELARVRPNEFHAEERLVPATAADRFRHPRQRAELWTWRP